MTDTFQTENELDEGTEGLDPAIRAELRRGRQNVADKNAAEKRTAELERELAFAKAGLPDTPLVEMFRKSYDGDLSPDAVKAAADELGIGATQQVVEVDPINPGAGAQDPLAAELAAKRRAAGATGSGASTGGITPGSQADYEARIKAVDPKSMTAEAQVMAIVAEAQRNNPELGIYPSGIDQ